MKTITEITDKKRPIGSIISDLKKKSIEIPAWSKLEKEYDPTKHPIKSDPLFLDKTEGANIVKVSKITKGLQRLATNRITEMMFGIPVDRIYKTEDDQQKKAADIMEKIFQRNRIDSVNIDRGKKLFCSCEIVTLWYLQELDQPHLQYGEPVKAKLRCKTYSPKDGDMIYPLFDEYDDLIALSIEYTRSIDNVKVKYFDTYSANEHIRWKDEKEEEIREQISILKIPGVYIYRPTPIWEDKSENVSEMEYTLSRNGNYIRKNAKPIFAEFTDKELQTGEKSSDDRVVLKFGKGEDAKYITWEQATESVKFHIDALTDDFFTELQLPNISFTKLMSEAMSGEARKWVFVDSQLKTMDESGRWLEFFDREVNIIKEFMKIMYPNLKNAIDSMQVEQVITPFTLGDETEKIDNLTRATGGKAIMSRRTAVQSLGYVDDVDAEMLEIESDEMEDLNNPTI